MWCKHYELRLIEANDVWPTANERTREEWASTMADQDSADEESSHADRLVDAAKDRGL
jgi:hypothetical protein